MTANALVIALFTKKRNRKSKTAYLLQSLAISDGIMAVVGGTMYCVNAFFHRWVFQHIGEL